MFSQVSVCPQLALWILVHCSALLRRSRYTFYWNAFLLLIIFTKEFRNLKNTKLNLEGILYGNVFKFQVICGAQSTFKFSFGKGNQPHNKLYFYIRFTDSAVGQVVKWRREGKKHEIYAATFGGHLFYDLFLQDGAGGASGYAIETH